MPTYEYRCNSCNDKFDLFYKTYGSVEQNPLCPECNSEKTERLMSVFAATEAESSQEFTGCGPGCGCVPN